MKGRTMRKPMNAVMEEVEDLGKALQNLGRTFARRTSDTFNTAADETLSAAEEALRNARARVKMARLQLRKAHATAARVTPRRTPRARAVRARTAAHA